MIQKKNWWLLFMWSTLSNWIEWYSSFASKFVKWRWQRWQWFLVIQFGRSRSRPYTKQLSQCDTTAGRGINDNTQVYYVSPANEKRSKLNLWWQLFITGGIMRLRILGFFLPSRQCARSEVVNDYELVTVPCETICVVMIFWVCRRSLCVCIKWNQWYRFLVFGWVSSYI